MDGALTTFMQTFEFDVSQLQVLMTALFDKHSTFLEQQFSLLFDQVSPTLSANARHHSY
jgi:hypothetical protein